MEIFSKWSLLILAIIAKRSLSSQLLQLEAPLSSKVISDLIDGFFEEKSVRFDIIRFGSSSKRISNIIETILPSIGKNIYELRVIDEKNREEVSLNRSALLIFDSFRIFKIFNRKIVLNNEFPGQLHFVVFYPGARTRQLLSLKYLNIMQFQSFIAKSRKGGRFKLIKVHQYSKQSCNSLTYDELNRFDKAEHKWIRPKFVSPPVRDFFGCTMVFGIPKYPPCSDFQVSKNSEGQEVIEYSGINIKLIETLAEHLNFKYEFNGMDSRKKRKYVAPSLRNSIILVIRSGVVFHSIRRDSYNTQPYIFEKLNFLVPSGEPYTSFEKMFLPFDHETWIWLSITFAVTFATISAVSYFPKPIRDYVFGTNVTTPALNVWIAFAGLGQIVLPRRNFARFLLIQFILFSLIIRTAFQGKSFEFLTQVMRRRGIQSLSELIERNFSIYAQTNYFQHWDESQLLKM